MNQNIQTISFQKVIRQKLSYYVQHENEVIHMQDQETNFTTRPNQIHCIRTTHKHPYINAIYIAILKYLALYKKANLQFYTLHEQVNLPNKKYNWYGYHFIMN